MARWPIIRHIRYFYYRYCRPVGPPGLYWLDELKVLDDIWWGKR